MLKDGIAYLLKFAPKDVFRQEDLSKKSIGH